MLSIILLAPPAAGKGTEAKKIQTDYNIPHISTGDLLRAEIKNNSKYSEYLVDVMKSGKLVDDEIILNIIEKRITFDDCKLGYILDGFPRDINQAEKYNQLLNIQNKKIDYVFVIDIDINQALLRALGRRTCEKCGKIYNINFEPLTPKKLEFCDKCGTKLMIRNDDNAETYYERYKAYLKSTAPLIKYYQSFGIVYHVNGNRDSAYTHKQIKDILSNNSGV